MENFISGEKLIKDFGWQGFQYFDRLQKGLLQPYDPVTGRMIIDRNTAYGRKIIENFKQASPKTLEECEKIIRRGEIRFWKQHGGMPKSNKTEQRIKEKARIHYNFHLLEQNGCIQKPFTLSRDEKGASKQLREAKKWLFKMSDVLSFKKNRGKKRPNQEDKLKCQEIAIEVWKEYPLDYKYMEMHPEIKKIVGRQYKGKNTVHDWLAEVAPKKIKRPGIRSKDYIKEQLAICKILNIEAPKK